MMSSQVALLPHQTKSASYKLLKEYWPDSH